MSKVNKKPPATNTKVLQAAIAPSQTDAQALGAATVTPLFNAALTIDAYQGNIGGGVDLAALVESLQRCTDQAITGDLSGLEAMLIGQATALQTIFTSLARRAMNQEYQKHFETFLALALKAQSQSRATISALVDLKYPRQATFVKQANIAHGPQQVNNGSNPAAAVSHAEKIQTEQNGLLEDQSHGSTQLDTRATTTPARSDKSVETMAKVHRAEKRRR